MGKSSRPVIKTKADPAAKIAKRKAKIQRRLEKKHKELSKRYPKSVYEIQGNNIVRTGGRNPHKMSKKKR